MRASVRAIGALTGVALAAVVVAYAVSALADTYSEPAGIPRLIPFRARLDQGGVPVSGSLTATFELYDAMTGGTRLWGPETHTVTAVNGELNVMLGASAPIDPTVFAGGDAYVQIAIGTTQLSPRQRLGSVPYALRAQEAATAVGSLATDLSGRLRNTTDTLTGDLTVTGRVRAQSGVAPDYDSGWFAATRSSRYNLSHGLGVQPAHVMVWISPNSTGTPAYEAGFIWQNATGEGGRGVVVTDVTATSLAVRSGFYASCGLYDTYLTSGNATDRVCLNNGYVRVRAWK